jgi:lipopolysaccharide/colanic/teichoic acid biosynthesis glycosyltransferase
LAVDLIWVALSVFLALIIRDNFNLSVPRLQGILPYALICVLSAAVVFSAARLHRTLWRYVSLTDVLHLIAAVTIALLLALLGGFVFDRLEGVARSVPVTQWFVLVSAMIGCRVAVRILGERTGRKRRQSGETTTPAEHVLVIGVSDLTELYLCSVAEFAPERFVIVGILSPGAQLRGRFMRRHKVLGAPEDVQHIIAQLDIHGVAVDRIVVAQKPEQLSKSAQDAIRVVERSMTSRVEWLVESLGLHREGTPKAAIQANAMESQLTGQNASLGRGQYRHLKRVIDAIGAICLILALAPVLAFTAVVVAIDVGLPLVFWQQRPGRHGRAFKLYKFRTMRAAHDAEGKRVLDELRSSSIGNFLRRTWLDELPQLYNVLVGEMSFVGPRPLLPADQPKGQSSRLVVRPGLTGWAQVNVGRDVSPEAKAALDTWYIENASLWLDAKILLRTLYLMISGGLGSDAIAYAANTEADDPTRVSGPRSGLRGDGSYNNA